MSIRDLVPWGRQEERAPVIAGGSRARDAVGSPLVTLHREMNRLFDDIVGGWGMPTLGTAATWSWPSIEVKEKDDEIRVTAEVPGLSERDIDLSIDDGVLTIRGERRDETNDRDRGYSERFYGRFERRLALPSGVDEDKVDARFDNGVLSITLPRSPDAERRRRIPINAQTKH